MQADFAQRKHSSYWICGQFASSRSSDGSWREGAFAGKALLSKRFVEDDGGAVGQVERSGGGMEHWDAETAVWVLIKQLWRQSGGFPAKEKEVFGGVLNFGVVFGPCGFDKPKPSPVRRGLCERLASCPIDATKLVANNPFQRVAGVCRSSGIRAVRRGEARFLSPRRVGRYSRCCGEFQAQSRRRASGGLSGVDFLKANENLPRHGLGESAQSLDRRGFSTGFKIPAAR